MKNMKDNLYADYGTGAERFTFNENVADVFNDMLNRSIPGYTSILNQIGIFASHYVQEGSNVYDLGCSLGAVSLSIKRNIDKECKIISVDNSSAMVQRCRKVLARDTSPVKYEVIESDILDIDIRNASFIVLNFTLQFIDPQKRDFLMKTIYSRMNSGGALMLSEKISYDDKERTRLYDSFYYDFKRANGYSDMEISRKREALENVLLRDTRETHMNRLKSAGFSVVENWYSYLNFNSFLAIK